MHKCVLYESGRLPTYCWTPCIHTYKLKYRGCIKRNIQGPIKDMCGMSDILVEMFLGQIEDSTSFYGMQVHEIFGCGLPLHRPSSQKVF